MSSQNPIVTLEYLTPFDNRCKGGFVKTVEDVIEKLRPVLGSTITTKSGILNVVNKQSEEWNVDGDVVFKLRTNTLLDTRISNEVAKTTTVQYDSRMFYPESMKLLLTSVVELRYKPSEEFIKLALTTARRVHENTATN